ncbi:MAG: PIN domain-containing protein [Candidatus Obscuribacterales bacterium]|nr:PIN domain-containing protein [Candidatus Obscuribacterales bacterium]
MPRTLIDAGPLVAYYNAKDDWHSPVCKFLETFKGQFITTAPIITEVMWLLTSALNVQNELLSDLAKQLYLVEHLEPGDFERIAELNKKYSDVPADFADLSLVAVSERLQIAEIASLDSDFDIYRRLGNKKFKQVFPKHG